MAGAPKRGLAGIGTSSLFVLLTDKGENGAGADKFSPCVVFRMTGVPGIKADARPASG